MTGFLLKILAASTFISVAIKYGGSYLPIAGTTPTVLTAVLTPSLLLAIVFTLRWQNQRAAIKGKA